MAKRRKPRTVDELLGVSQAFVYELYNFQEASLLLHSSPNLRILNRCIVNSLIEGFAVHTRNIIDFLYANEKGRGSWYTDRSWRSNCVIADDFFDEDRFWRDNRVPETPLLKNAYQQVSNAVTHFNYGRQGPSKPGPYWDYLGILKDATVAMKDFLSKAPIDRVHADLRNFHYEA